MTRKYRHGKPILGYTDRNTVKLDFDNVCYEEVKYWAFKIMNEFKLGGFLILRSSERNYHVVYDRSISWAKNMSVVAQTCLETKSEGMIKWFLLKCRKQESTLRIGSKEEKAPPRVVFRDGKQDGEIRNYLSSREKILSFPSEDE